MAEKAEKKDAVEAEAKAPKATAAKKAPAKAAADKAASGAKAAAAKAAAAKADSPRRREGSGRRLPEGQEGCSQGEGGCPGIPPRRAQGAPPPSRPGRQHREDPRRSR